VLEPSGAALIEWSRTLAAMATTPPAPKEGSRAVSLQAHHPGSAACLRADEDGDAPVG
jgi:hypothetical protein